MTSKLREHIMINRSRRIQIIKLTEWLLKRWLMVFIIAFGIFNLLPFLAPVAAKAGMSSIANLIYTLYSPFCHQMAHRSFFFFGDQLMYSPNQLTLEINTDLTANMLALKSFYGNEAIGWKVAWSDRMVYMYGATWVASILFAWVSRRKQVHKLSWAVFIVLMLPMTLDGVTHMLSDYSGGLFAGFRYTNDWLANLTSNSLPQWFYIGDKLGSFNSWMRLVSGIGFGIAVVWMSFPLISREMFQSYRALIIKRQQQNNPRSLD